MVNEQRIDIAACVGTDALLGKIMGDSHFPLLLGAILKNPPGSVIYLDFSRITNITASYIAATIGRLLRMIPSESGKGSTAPGDTTQHPKDKTPYAPKPDPPPTRKPTPAGKLPTPA